MHFEFEHMGASTPFELPEGIHLLGGGTEDHVRLEGLPPGLLTLRIESQSLMVEAPLTFTVGGVMVPPGVPRLVLPGEVVGLPEGMSLKVRDPGGDTGRQVGTVAVLKHLLTDTEEPLASRAASLICLTGTDVSRTFALAEASTIIGRSMEATVRLRDMAVSRKHARIRHQEGSFLLEDLNSPNGVYLNGQRVEVPSLLREGDVIELGRTLLRFQAPMVEAPPAHPDSPAVPETKPVPPEAPASSDTPATSPAKDTPKRPRVRWEWWLIGLGAALSLVGLLATYALTA